MAGIAIPALQFWLQIDGFFVEGLIPGNPVPNAVKLNSFTLPASIAVAGRPGTGLGAPSRPNIGPVTFTRAIDGSTPKLLLHVLKGAAFSNITVTAILPTISSKPSGSGPPPHDRVSYTFKNAFISGWENDSTLTEKLTATFSAVTVSYNAGPIVDGVEWDLTTNQGAEFQS